MLNPKIQDAMNDQIQRELDSAYIYLSMAAYFDSAALPGMAQWMKVQFQEEQFHAQKFYDYVDERGGRIKLQPIGQPPVEFESPLDAFGRALAHEEKITGHINDLYALAVEEKDFASQIFLSWFVEEQVEEEKNANDIIDVLERIGDSGHPLLMFDKELSLRQFTAAAEAEAGAE